MIAAIGDLERAEWAIIRLSVSWIARRLGRPVRESVAARASASARLRRWASTGAAWATDSFTRRLSRTSNGLSWPTSTEPITSPLTSSGTQVDRSALTPQTSHSSSEGSLRLSRRCRASRTAKQDRGSALCSGSASGEPSERAVVASRRSLLLFLLSTTTRLPGTPRSIWSLRISWASGSVSVTCRISENASCAAR